MRRDSPTNGNKIPATMAITSTVLGIRQSDGRLGAPSDPAGRRFHHITAAEICLQHDRHAGKQQRDLIRGAELLAHMNANAPFRRAAERAEVREAHVEQHFARVLVQVDHPLVGNVVGIDRGGEDPRGPARISAGRCWSTST
jgi:hypothetical protein